MVFKTNLLFKEAVVGKKEGKGKLVPLIPLVKQRIVQHHRQKYEYDVLTEMDSYLTHTPLEQRKLFSKRYVVKRSSLLFTLNKQLIQLDSLIREHMGSLAIRAVLLEGIAIQPWLKLKTL